MKKAVHADIAAAINLILYLCTENPDISGDYEWRSRPRDARKPVKAAVKWDVGVRIGNAIRRYRNERARFDEDDTYDEHGRDPGERSAPRPHIRRAHWHHFWSGPKAGDRTLTLRWLPPIPVAMDEDAELPVVVRPVE